MIAVGVHDPVCSVDQAQEAIYGSARVTINPADWSVTPGTAPDGFFSPSSQFPQGKNRRVADVYLLLPWCPWEPEAARFLRMRNPKTARGRRTVALDPKTVAALREHRQNQLAERLLMGAGFTDHDLVFCRPDGSPLHPERFSRTFAIEAARAGLPLIRCHDLRHTWATLALSAGEHPKVVQERLGHANVSITLDVYSHVTEGLHGEAASRVAGIIFGAPSGTPLASR